MKKILFFTVMLTSLVFGACTKKTIVEAPPTDTNPNPIVGLWVGTFQIDNAPSLGPYYYSYNLFADSTLVQQGGAPNGQIWAGKGTWSLKSGTAWSAAVTNTDMGSPSWAQTITATYDSVGGTLSTGKWKFTSGGNTTGTFTLKRVQ